MKRVVFGFSLNPFLHLQVPSALQDKLLLHLESVSQQFALLILGNQLSRIRIVAELKLEALLDSLCELLDVFNFF